MNTTNLARKIQSIIADDADLLAWCHEAYNTQPTVYIGVRTDNPIPIKDYPVVAIVSITRAFAGRDIFTAVIGVGVVNEAIAMSGNRREFTGMLEVETMREIVCDAMIRARFAKISFTDLVAENSVYPIFSRLFEAEIEIRQSRRRNHGLQE